MIGPRRTTSDESAAVTTTQPEGSSAKPSSKPSAFQVEVPRYTFDDIVLSDKVRNEILNVLAFREKANLVYETWGLNKTHKHSKKVGINLYGDPGTGKTMAAHAIAAHLSRDLISVNYADIESKYVGDTSKNLVEIFEFARESGGILFFDEADAMLSRRVTNMSHSTDVSVNQTRSVLLMLLNNHQDVILFATNFISNFDPAFMRRILAHVHFELPDVVERQKIWSKLLPCVFRTKSATESGKCRPPIPVIPGQLFR